MSSTASRSRIGTNLPARRRAHASTVRGRMRRRGRRVSRWWRRRPAWVRRTVAATGGAIVVALLAAAWIGVSTFAELRQARAKLDDAAQAVLDRRVEDANTLLDGAEGDLDAARSRSSGFPARFLSAIPLVGSPFKAARSAADAGDLVVDGTRLLAEASDRFPTEGVAGVDGNDLSALHDASQEAAGSIAMARASFEAARREMDGPSSAALDWVSGPSARMVEVIDDGLVRLDNAERALRLAAELTGAQADHRILVLAMNSLELRPVGGYFGSFGVLEFRGGTVELVRYDSFDALAEAEPALPVPDYLDVALAGTPYGLENAGWWPEFPHAAAEASELFRRQGGGEVTGVVAINEDLVGELLGVFGPTAVPGYEVPVTADTFEDRVIAETLLKDPPDVPRKRFTIELSELVFDRLLHLPADDVPAVGRIFANAVGRGELQAWFPDPELQSLLTGTLTAGAFPDVDHDFLAVTEANVARSKANKDLSRVLTYRVIHDRGSSLRARLSITYHNEGEASDLVNPYYSAFVRVYAPAGSRLITDSDEMPPPDAAEDGDGESVNRSGVVPDSGDFFDEGMSDDTGYQVFSRSIIVEPGERRSVVLEYELPEQVLSGDRYALTWVRQPGTSADSLQVLVDGERHDGSPDQRLFEVEANLGGNPVADWVRDRWVVDKIFG